MFFFDDITDAIHQHHDRNDRRLAHGHLCSQYVHKFFKSGYCPDFISSASPSLPIEWSQRCLLLPYWSKHVSISHLKYIFLTCSALNIMSCPTSVHTEASLCTTTFFNVSTFKACTSTGTTNSWIRSFVLSLTHTPVRTLAPQRNCLLNRNLL